MQILKKLLRYDQTSAVFMVYDEKQRIVDLENCNGFANFEKIAHFDETIAVFKVYDLHEIVDLKNCSLLSIFKLLPLKPIMFSNRRLVDQILKRR